jgi:predicted transcriptional regulator
MGSASAFTVGTDLGRYKYFTLLIPLYTRLNKGSVLDNFTRGRIFEHIRKNPGDHFSALKKILDLNSGCLSYHLNVLEKEEYIKSQTDGFTKRFYPSGMKITKDQPKNIQELILQKIDEMPAITQKELAAELGVDISTVNYHINMMTGAGIIVSEKKGRIKHYYVLTEATPVSESAYT